MTAIVPFVNIQIGTDTVSSCYEEHVGQLEDESMDAQLLHLLPCL